MSVIACLVTGEARAAIATICVSGVGTSAIIDANFKAASPRLIEGNEVRFGVWHGRERGSEGLDAAESVVVVRIAAHAHSPRHPDFLTTPHADTWEINCHGGAAATQRILEDLKISGASVVKSDAWQQIGGVELLVREAAEALANTTTARTAAIVLDQARGAFVDWVNQTLDRITNGGELESIRVEILQVLCYADFGLHLTQPWKVVLVGAPNVGKSSLINALVGYTRSITLDQPGTTRDVLKAHAVVDGWPILLFDTAGVRENPEEDIERQGIELTKLTSQHADLLLWITDDSSLNHFPQDTFDYPHRRCLHVLNKVDRGRSGRPQLIAGTIKTSAVTGEGLNQLREAIVDSLIPKVPKPGSPVPLCERQVERLQVAADAVEPATMAKALSELRQK